MKPYILLVAIGLLFSTALGAQHKVTATLLDSQNGEPVSFATVSLTREGAKNVYKYVLSGDDGKFVFDGVRAAKYVLRAELLGYKTFSKAITVEKDLDLGVLKVAPDAVLLQGATVSDVGNPIIIKKDTIEYNASSFKTTDNDVLEDLLKKLPGIEIGDDGSITSNGKTIDKITIGGKTFFLDDPQLASKNIPANIINKVKVVNKKSEQAEFTGIDDGEEETVIDLTVKRGMMHGSFGNVMGGVGHDIPASEGLVNDWRYQGAGFLGNFTDKRQLSVILNANNTNNRGFNDLSGNMMGNMRGGRGGGEGFRNNTGITTSYMAGANGAWTLCDGQMDLGANYLFNHTGKDVLSATSKTTYLDDYNLLYDKKDTSFTNSNGHRFGIRLDHVFSKNTSILFEPRIEFGNGNYVQSSAYNTYADSLNGRDPVRVNYGDTRDVGYNSNVTTSGFALLRQRLGKAGRTLTVMSRYSLSDNRLNSTNVTNTYVTGKTLPERVNQEITQRSNSYSLWGRVTYTEPIAKNLFIEANYRYSWALSKSEKNTWDNIADAQSYEYSNEIVNRTNQHNIGMNLMYQMDKSRAQIGFSAIPVKTYNSTTRYNSSTKKYSPVDTTYTAWKFAPSAMVWWEFSENANARLFYRGNVSQPSTSQLMPVPDNTDPLNVNFGNPTLKPYFSHNLNGDVRYNNKKTFASFNVRFNGSYTSDPVVSAIWYSNGAAYSMPLNGPDAFSAGLFGFANIPLGRSKFSISNFTRANYSESSSYIGSDIDMSTYTTGNDYYGFMEELLGNVANDTYFAAHFTENRTRTLGVTERLRLIYRTDALELSASGRTRMNRSTYTISSSNNILTFNNQIRLTATWTWDGPGLTFKGEGDYNWYNGYSNQDMAPEYVLNAEIQKYLFKKKFTLAVKCYDILGQAKQLSVTDSANYHSEVLNNTLGRYIIASLTYRFGNFDRSKMRGPGMGGPGGPPRMR